MQPEEVENENARGRRFVFRQFSNRSTLRQTPLTAVVDKLVSCLDREKYTAYILVVLADNIRSA